MRCQPPAVRQAVDEEWVAFPGGELEGWRPQSDTLCFQCYRAELDRRRADTRLPAPLVRRAHASTIAFPERDRDPTYSALTLRRRRAQITARHAIADAKNSSVRELLVAVSP